MSALSLNRQQLAKHIQFTNVLPDATYSEIVTHLETALKYNFHAAMISMCWVPLARKVLQGSDIFCRHLHRIGHSHESLDAKISMIRMSGTGSR
jgi:deoxyribose-phosphate aldolase